MNRLEKDLQKDVLKFVKEQGIFHIRTQMGTKSGLPDVILCHAGRFIGIELKREDGVGFATAQQLMVGKDIQKSGGEFYVISSLVELKKVLGYD